MGVAVRKVEEGIYEACVDDATKHKVHVDFSYAKKTAPNTDHKRLVEASFKFLLDREPKESILKEFHLSVIETYFPDYKKEIIKYLRA